MINIRRHISVGLNNIHDHKDNFPPDRYQNLREMVFNKKSPITYMPMGTCGTPREGMPIGRKISTATTPKQFPTIEFEEKLFPQISSDAWTWRQPLSFFELYRVLPEIIKTVRVIWKSNVLIQKNCFWRSWTKLKRMVCLRRLSFSPQGYHLLLMFPWRFRVKKSPSCLPRKQCLISFNICPAGHPNQICSLNYVKEKN